MYRHSSHEEKNMVNIQLIILIFKSLHANQPTVSDRFKEKNFNYASQPDVHRITDVKLCSLYKGYIKILPAKLDFFPLESWQGKT